MRYRINNKNIVNIIDYDVFIYKLKGVGYEKN